MLSALYPVIAIQLPTNQAGQLLLVIGISFVVITLIASTYRFHRLVQLDETALPTVDDCNNFFFIQITRYLSKINRKTTGFGLVIVEFEAQTDSLRTVQEAFLHQMENLIRNTTDKVCLFRENGLGIIVDTESENLSEVTVRLVPDIQKAIRAVPEIHAWKGGASGFPLHGLKTQELIDCATQAMENIPLTPEGAISIAPEPVEETPDEKTPDEGALEQPPKKGDKSEEELGELGKEDKHAALDPLTGVLRPKVIGSYMRKYLADLRHQKQAASLLCVSINRIDNVIHLHGEAAADDLIAGVSEVLQSFTRKADLIGRFNRESFLILAPCTLQQGEMIAIRLREAVQKKLFMSGVKKIKTSISIGITAYPNHGRLLRDLFSGAHTALKIVQRWETSACLVYDPAKHSKKAKHATRR